MSTLDNPGLVSTPPTSIWPTVLRYGLIGGLIFIVYSLLGNILGFTRPSAGLGMLALNTIISIVLYVGIMVVAVRHYRDTENAGVVSFGKAFLIGLMVALILGVMNSLFLYVYVTAIDPTFLQSMVGEMQGMYEKMGMNEEQIEAAMAQAEKSMTTSGMIRQSMIGTVILGGILAAIVGAVMKKNPVGYQE